MPEVTIKIPKKGALRRLRSLVSFMARKISVEQAQDQIKRNCPTPSTPNIFLKR